MAGSTSVSWVIFVALLLAAFSKSSAKDPVHILYLTDCTPYSDWQTVGMAFSFKNSGQRGHITRVMCCTDEEKAKYNKDMLALMPSHVAPSFAYDEKTKDYYAAFNKPGAVLDFMTKGNPLADYMLVIDSDMQLRHPFIPTSYNMTRGLAISADYTYMIGCTNDLAPRHIPEIGKRNDSLAGPYGRYCDMVGGYTFMHKDDLAKVAPLWLSITEDVREDPESWRLSGDQYVEKGGKPWISEMYGYSFACAKSGVWHHWDTSVMHYPTYQPTGVPKLMHYGLEFQVGSWAFDKHWHYSFDVTKCPPWDLKDKKRTGGVFEFPPRPSTLPYKDQAAKYYRDLLSIETVATLNAGFCDFHLRNCPPSQQLYDVCKEALDLIKEVTEEVENAEGNHCKDFHEKCPEWAEKGECQSNPDYMNETCKKSCGVCAGGSASASQRRPATEELERNLASLREKLGAGQAGRGVDPDSKAVSPIIPHDTTSPQTTTVSASPVHSPPPPPSPPPSPSASPPPPPPLPSPSPPPPVIAAMPGSVTTASSVQTPKTRKELLTRCYRMALSLSEVKECVAAAKEGAEYSRKLMAKASHDSEDLSLQQSPVVMPSDSPPPEQDKAASPQPIIMSRLPTWQALGIWLVVVAAILVLAPRVLNLRRRARSGQRTE